MTKKILVSIIGVSLVIMVICTGLIMGIMYDYMEDKVDEQLVDEAILIEDGWKIGGQQYLDTLEARLQLKNRVTFMSEDGEVIFDSMADTANMENHLAREEVQEAIETGEGWATRTSDTLSEDTRYYAKKLKDGYILRIAANHYSQWGLVMDTFGMLLISLVVLLVLGFIISYRVTMAIIKPINEINLDNPEIDDSYEEIAPLLHRINQQNVKIKKQIEKLRKSREEFNIITENMSEGLVIIDRDMEVLTYNKSAVQMLSGGNDEHFDGSVLKLNRSEPFRKAVSEALAGRNSQVYLTIGENTYEIISNPAREKSQVSGAILIILDVTEREEGDRLRREFTSNVSHELKTPLTSIYGVSDMLASGMVKPEDVAGFARTIKEESSRLISLINDIINLSQLDESTVPQEMVPVDMAEVAADVVARLASRAAENQVTINFDGQPAEIMGAEYIIDEIIYNICENAIKYNKPGGTVDVTVRNMGTECVLTVRDNGIGIPASVQDRVFERFYRVDKSHSRKIGGTGLGLSIVKHAVAYLGGNIRLESEEGIGTIVVVNFSK